MAEPIAPSPDIVRRVIAAECRYTLTRLRVLERLDGNPVGVAYKLLGDAFAFSARHIANSTFNRVAGLDDDQAHEVPGLIAWFAERKLAGAFEINPGTEQSAVMVALRAAGFANTGFHAVTFGAPAPTTLAEPGVSVEHVTATTLDDFFLAYAKGWSIPNPEGFKTNTSGWIDEPGWTLYLARWQGAPAGAAILYMDGKTAYCADSAVDPDFRGHGLHQAMLRRRRSDALTNGADLVCAQAAYLSTSHRNMIRAGLQTLHTKAIWTKA
jgi:hypothetical protein